MSPGSVKGRGVETPKFQNLVTHLQFIALGDDTVHVPIAVKYGTHSPSRAKVVERPFPSLPCILPSLSLYSILL